MAENLDENTENKENGSEPHSFYAQLLLPEDELKAKNPLSFADLKEARDAFIDSYALSSVHAEGMKKLLRGQGPTRAQMSNMAGMTAFLGQGAGAITNVENAAMLAGVIVSSTTGGAGGPVVAAVKTALKKIPYIDQILQGTVGACIGLLCGGAVYLYASLDSKAAALNDIRRDMEDELEEWEKNHLQSKHIHLQHAAEILTKYLRKKSSGIAFSGSKLVLLSNVHTYNESSFIRINQYVKALLMFITYADSLPARTVETYLDAVELDLKNPIVAKGIKDKEFVKVFMEFKKFVLKYLKQRSKEQTVVEMMGKTLVLGSAAVTPTLPVVASVFFPASSLYFYNAKKFKKSIFVEIYQRHRWFLSIFETDLNNVIANDKDRFEKSKNKFKEISQVLFDAFAQKENLEKKRKNNEDITSISQLDIFSAVPEQYFTRVEDLVKSAFILAQKMYSEEVHIDTYLFDKIEELKVALKAGSNTLESPTPDKHSDVTEKVANYLKAMRSTLSVNRESIYNLQALQNKDDYLGLVKDYGHFLAIVLDMHDYMQANPYRTQYEEASLVTSQGRDGQAVTVGLATRLEKYSRFTHYIAFYGSLVPSPEDNQNIPGGVLNFFLLWVLYHTLIDKYSFEIPDEVKGLYSEEGKFLEQSKELKRFLIIPPEMFESLLLQGFNGSFLEDKKDKDFVSVYLYYLTHIINTISEIEYHMEALKTAKYLIALLGETELESLYVPLPVYILLQKVKHVKTLLAQLRTEVEKVETTESYRNRQSHIIDTFMRWLGFLDEGVHLREFLKRCDNLQIRFNTFENSLKELYDGILGKVKNYSENTSFNRDVMAKSRPFMRYAKDTYGTYLFHYLTDKYMRNPDGPRKDLERTLRRLDVVMSNEESLAQDLQKSGGDSGSADGRETPESKAGGVSKKGIALTAGAVAVAAGVSAISAGVLLVKNGRVDPDSDEMLLIANILKGAKKTFSDYLMLISDDPNVISIFLTNPYKGASDCLKFSATKVLETPKIHEYLDAFLANLDIFVKYKVKYDGFADVSGKYSIKDILVYRDMNGRPESGAAWKNEFKYPTLIYKSFEKHKHTMPNRSYFMSRRIIEHAYTVFAPQTVNKVIANEQDKKQLFLRTMCLFSLIIFDSYPDLRHNLFNKGNTLYTDSDIWFDLRQMDNLRSSEGGELADDAEDVAVFSDPSLPADQQGDSHAAALSASQKRAKENIASDVTLNTEVAGRSKKAAALDQQVAQQKSAKQQQLADDVDNLDAKKQALKDQINDA